MPPEMITIRPLPWWRAALLSRGGKKRNKRLLSELSAFNLLLSDKRIILASLGLKERDLNLLKQLAKLSEGWHPYNIEAEETAGDPGKPLELGLVILNWPGRRICLSDAGRFLLSLTAPLPEM